ncbi:hypothetical protein N0V88_006791 [Collariella sp. IMI 366227]|nr:hypothetical protein N0V88_006791 [Collariella sp. IMI 366227]
MARKKTARKASTRNSKDPAQGVAPPTGKTQPITTAEASDNEMEDDEMEDGDEMGGEDGNGINPLHDESDETLAGIIVHLAEEPNDMVAQMAADEMMTRLRRLRQKVQNGKRGEGDNEGMDTAALHQTLINTVAEAVGQGVEKAVEDVRKEMQEVQKELQEVRRELQAQKKKEASIPATTAARSWAAVVAGEGELPKKIIPGRLNKEILVRGSTEPSLTRRSPQEIIRAVNGISEKKGAIAARKLPSGDVIVTFHDAETKEWHAKNGGWIGIVFGEAAKEARRTFAVLIKGMLKRDLKDVTETVFGRQLGLSSVEKSQVQDSND